VLYPDFESAKVRQTVKARRQGQGAQDDFNLGWETHPFMHANVELEVLQTLGRHGPRTPISPYANLAAFKNDGNGGTVPLEDNWGNPCGFSRPSGVDAEDWDAVDLNIICKLRDWLPGGSRTQIPVYWRNDREPYFKTSGTRNSLVITPPVQQLNPSQRLVRRCNTCPETPPNPQWTWNQQVQYSIPQEFVTGVDVMNGDTNAITRPQLHHLVNDVAIPEWPDFANQYPARAARDMAFWRLSDYRNGDDGYYLDVCVKVQETTTSGDYVYVPTVCEVDHILLCQRDNNKYAVRSGMQCDACGDSARNGAGAQPNTTCFDRFALADPNRVPEAHRIKDAYQDGTLILYIQQNEYDYDTAAAFILNSTVSYILAFPEFLNFFQQSISTQPGYLTPGQTQDPDTWINADIQKLFPYDCGPVRNPQTGIERNLCATTADKCDYSYINGNTSALSEDAYPIALRPVAPGEDYTTIPRCGALVKPTEYNVRDNYGGGALTTDDFNVLSKTTQGSIQLQAKGINGTWLNSGKNTNGYTVTTQRFTNVTGTVECDACVVTLYAGNLEVNFGTPRFTEIIDTRTGSGELRGSLIAPNSSVIYQVWGWFVDNISPGDVIVLDRLIVSNNETHLECQLDNLVRDWVNPPEAIESGQVNDNFCNDDGVCECRGTAFAGPACDKMALDTPVGTLICGGDGDGNARVMGPDGEIYPTDAYGSYTWGFSEPGCKPIDFGAVIKTYRNPRQGSGYPFVVTTSKPRNSPNFIYVPYIDDFNVEPIDFLTTTGYKEVCSAGSATLASWTSSDQINSWQTETFNDFAQPIGMGIDGDQLVWEQRNFVIEDSLETNSVPLPAAGNISFEDKKTLNWNNIAFMNYLSSQNDGIFNGELDNATVTLATSYGSADFAGSPVIELNWTLAHDVVIAVYGELQIDETYFVGHETQNNCGSAVYTGQYPFQIVCSVQGINVDDIRFYRQGGAATFTWQQMLILNNTWDGRNPGRSVYFPL
jgi:hypothetical protein